MLSWAGLADRLRVGGNLLSGGRQPRPPGSPRGGGAAPRLRAALENLNPGQPPEAISAAIEELSRNRSAMGLVAVFAHIEKAYPERDRSVYSLAGLSSPAQQPEHQGQAG
ncbi:hypothetical protein [Vulcanococcus limneticus]|uniref:hypothetical protein n=1 Tax=Vulcanococcus limneticus TaxID=2170428 RepID=UPI00398C0938